MYFAHVWHVCTHTHTNENKNGSLKKTSYLSKDKILLKTIQQIRRQRHSWPDKRINSFAFIHRTNHDLFIKAQFQRAQIPEAYSDSHGGDGMPLTPRDEESKLAIHKLFANPDALPLVRVTGTLLFCLAAITSSRTKDIKSTRQMLELDKNICNTPCLKPANRGQSAWRRTNRALSYF